MIRIDGNVTGLEKKIEGSLSFANMQINGSIDLSNIKIGKKLDLSYSQINGDVNLSGLKAQEVRLYECNIAGDLILNNAKINGIVDPNGMSAQNIYASDAKFGRLYISGSKIAHNVEFRNSRIGYGSFTIRCTEVGNDVVLSNADIGTFFIEALEINGDLILSCMSVRRLAGINEVPDIRGRIYTDGFKAKTFGIGRGANDKYLPHALVGYLAATSKKIEL